ncbi:MAG: hypothetical protein JNL63_10220 [Bacteroidia bacterium]|nr:hypothetical protein [Bacteroidia bacterium]
MKEIRTTTAILILTLVQSVLAVAQFEASVSAGTSKGWIRNDVFQDKVFIENKGQFAEKEKQLNSDILFGLNEGEMQVYFSSNGITYLYDKLIIPQIKESERENEEIEEGGKEKEMLKKIKTVSYSVNMEWLNANPDVKVISENIVPHYFTYGDQRSFFKASAYKNITYKNLYPGIDVEYIFHEKEGIKYSIIVHPGADVSKIKMKYTGAGKLKTSNNGDLHINIPLGDIIDHAPVTFYEDDKSSTIHSSYNLNNNVISFNLENYNTSKTIIIDPWTVGVTLATTNKALEVEKDDAGNIYILGGGDAVMGNASIAYSVKKYNSTGALIWTYSFPNASISKGWYGDDLKIDKAGNLYISTGLAGPNIWKINPAGTVVWSSSYGSEPYRILSDCAFNILYIPSSWPPVVYLLNPATGIQTNSINNYFTLIGQTSEDPRDMILSSNGNFYAVTFEQGNTARIRAFNSGWGNLWNTPAGFPGTYWFGAYSGHSNGYPASLHMIATSKQFLYITNGAILQKRNLGTGALISTITIPGGVAITSTASNSGIVTDTCGNVYVSSQNAVYKYDPNLTFIASAATTAAVYDVCLGNNGEILACGNGFLASLNLSACTIDPLNVTATATPTGNCSNGNLGTATATITGGLSSYSYYWIPGGQSTPSITGLGAGTYKVIVTDGNCNKDTAVVTVTSSGALVTSVTQTNLKCYGGNTGSATISASNGATPYAYTWSNGNTTTTATGLSAGSFTATVTDANGCKSIVTVSIPAPPQIPISITTTGTQCNNANGTATATVSGSTGPYTYSWSNGTTSQNGNINLLAAGTHTLTVTDSKGCTQTATANVAPSTSPVDPSFTQSPNGTVCIGTNVNFTNTGTPPGTGITYNWLISTITPANVSGTTTNFSYAFLTVGTYTVTHSVNDGTCNTSLKSTITVINCTGPNVTATGNSVCPGSCGSVTSSTVGGTGPYTYLWSTGGTTQNINPCPATTTTYTVTITDNTGATATSTATITINPVVTVIINATNLTCNGSNDGTAQASGSAGTSPYTYNWSGGVPGSGFQVSGLSAGNYTVTVTDNKGCTGTSSITIAAPPLLSGQFSKGTANCSGCGCKEWLMVTAAGGTSPYSYSWTDGYVNRYKNQLCPGAYLINIKDKNGCSVNISLTAP